MKILSKKTALSVSICLLVLVVPILPAFPSGTQSQPIARSSDFAVQSRAGQGTSPPRTVQHTDMPHTLAASLYDLKEGLASTLMLSNQGPHQMNIQVTLFGLGGAALDAPTVTLEGNTVGAFDLGEWAQAGGEDFRAGSVQVSYEGKDMELGGVVKLADGEHSLIFDEELSEPAKEFASSSLEAVWWLPTRTAQMRFAVSNTTRAPLTARVIVDLGAPTPQDPHELALGPHETRVLALQDMLANRPQRPPTMGGITIQHSGSPGAVLARGLIQEPSIGYSSIMQFVDPGTAKSSRLDGAGLRIGKLTGKRLTSIAVARNIGTTETTLTGRISYTRDDGKPGEVLLAPMRLGPREVGELDLAAAARSNGLSKNVSSAALEFEHTGPPGAVVMSAQSVSTSGDQVFRVPLVDIAAQHSSTGKYPWSIDGSSSSIIYLKNGSDRPQQYTLQVNFAGGSYSLGLKTLAAGQPATLDMRKLRDDQIPDANGHTLPLTASNGQAIWSVYGAENRVLLGRVEQVDLVNGMSMTAACPTCCPNSFSYGYVDPGLVRGLIGDSGFFSAWEIDQDCYGNYLGGFNPGAGFSSDNTSVATCDYNGFATAVGTGTTSIWASWFAPSWYQFYEECEYSPVDALYNAVCDVLDVLFLRAYLVDSSRSADFGLFNSASLDINTCGGERFAIKATFKLPHYSSSCCSNPTTSFVVLPSDNKFEFAPSLIDGTIYDFFGNDTPPYVIIYLRRKAGGGGSSDSVRITVGGTYQDGSSYTGQGTVHLVCQ